MNFQEAWSDTCSSVGLAARSADVKALKRLLNARRPVDVSDNRGYRPVHEAAASLAENSLTCLQILLEQEDTDVNWETYYGETPLILAVKVAKSFDKVKLLLEAGAKIITQFDNPIHDPPLFGAVNDNRLDMLRELLTRMKDGEINVRNTRGFTVLHEVCDKRSADLECVKLLIQSGASISATDDGYDMTPVFISAKQKNSECLKLLLDHAKNQGNVKDLVETSSVDGATPLFIATQKGSLQCVHLLLAHGACPETMAEDFATPVHAAIEKHHASILEELLKYTDIKEWYKFSRIPDFLSPLHFAVMWESHKCLDVMLSSGLDPNLFTQQISSSTNSIYFDMYHHFDDYKPTYDTALCPAVYNDDPRMIVSLLTAGAHPTPIDDDVVDPNCVAMYRYRIQASETLIEHGANVDYCVNGLPVFLQAALRSDHFFLPCFSSVLRVGVDPLLCLNHFNDTFWIVKDLISHWYRIRSLDDEITNNERYGLLEQILLHCGHSEKFGLMIRQLQHADCDELHSDIILAMMSRTLTLEEQSRIVIRKNIIRRMKDDKVCLKQLSTIIESLDLPKTLSNFLQHNCDDG